MYQLHKQNIFTPKGQTRRHAVYIVLFPKNLAVTEPASTCVFYLSLFSRGAERAIKSGMK